VFCIRYGITVYDTVSMCCSHAVIDTLGLRLAHQ